jgi:hypothetical protein
MRESIFIYLFYFLFLDTFIYSQTKVGINTSLPNAALHVKDSSTIFTGPNNLPVTPVLPPILGSGHRNMWYVDKAAWTAGSTIGDNWNKDSLGNYSFALGINPKSLGLNSIAWGENAISSNENSISILKNSMANGNGAIALGTSSRSSGENSIAIGKGCVTLGVESIALGRSTTAIGNHSISLNSFTKSTGDISFSAGNGTESKGDLSITFGLNNITYAYNCLTLGRNSQGFSASNPAVWVPHQPILIIGNGPVPGELSNILLINKNGQTGINLGTTIPKSMFHIKNVSTINEKHIRLENSGDNKFGTIRFDDHFNHQSHSYNSEFKYKDSIGNTLMKLKVGGDLSISGHATFGMLASSDETGITVIQDNQLINVEDITYLRLMSNSSSEVSRTINLTNGNTIGQMLLIECGEPLSSTNGFEIMDDGINRNTNTDGDFIMNSQDSALFIWNGIDWLLVRRSNN